MLRDGRAVERCLRIIHYRCEIEHRSRVPVSIFRGFGARNYSQQCGVNVFILQFTVGMKIARRAPEFERP